MENSKKSAKFSEQESDEKTCALNYYLEASPEEVTITLALETRR